MIISVVYLFASAHYVRPIKPQSLDLVVLSVNALWARDSG